MYKIPCKVLLPNVYPARKSHLLWKHHVYSHYARQAEQCQMQLDGLLPQDWHYQCYCWVMNLGVHLQDLFQRTVYINWGMSVEWAKISTSLKCRYKVGEQHTLYRKRKRDTSAVLQDFCCKKCVKYTVYFVPDIWQQ